MSNGVLITLIICVTLVIISYNNKGGKDNDKSKGGVQHMAEEYSRKAVLRYWAKRSQTRK